VLDRAVVAPTDVDVVATDPDHPDRPAAAATRALLTLTTCHPEFSARQRLVVRAELVSAITRPAAALSRVPSGPLATSTAAQARTP
jgi:sortase A